MKFVFCKNKNQIYVDVSYVKFKLDWKSEYRRRLLRLLTISRWLLLFGMYYRLSTDRTGVMLNKPTINTILMKPMITPLNCSDYLIRLDRFSAY